MESKFYSFIRPILSFLFKVIFRPNIIGIENIPNEGRIILAGNHTSNLDCILLMSSTKRHIHFLAKDELWKFPKNIIFDNLGLIPVNRREKDSNCLKMARQYLNNELVIGIFPEGTISKTGNLLPFKIGAVKLASDTNSKIVPFTINGKYRYKKISITFHESIKIRENLEKENNRLKTIVKEGKYE